MHLKIKKPIVFFDLETTGVNTTKDRIVQIAAIKYLPNGKSEKINMLFDPLVPIPKEASEVHGIYKKHVKDKPSFAEKASDIHRWVQGCDFGGYNIIRFDLPLLEQEFSRAGLDFDYWDANFVDAFVLFNKKEKRDLSSAYRFYTHKQMENAHDALADIEATVEIVDGQAKGYSIASVEDFYKAASDPDAADMSGKLKWKGEDIVITFGKHKNKKLQDVDPSYLQWTLKNNVFDKAGERCVMLVLDGKKPIRDA